MKRASLVLLFLLATVCSADTGWYAVNGYLKQGTFAFNADGYWYLGTQGYTREWVPPSYSGGYCSTCYTPGYWYYQPYYSPAKTLPTDDDYINKIIGYAIKKDSEASRVDNAIKLATAVGIKVPPQQAQGGYAAAPGYGVQSQGQYSYVVNGSSFYAYSPAAQVYNDIDLNQQQQSQFRLGQQSLDLADKITAGHQLVYDKALDLRSRDKLLIEGLKVLAAAAAQKTTQATITQYGSPPVQVLPGPPMPMAQSLYDSPANNMPSGTVLPAPLSDQGKAAIFQTIRQDCIACHDAKNKAGGFIVDAFPSMASGDRYKVIQRLLLPSADKKAMPRTADGKHARLSDVKISAWISLVK